MNYAAAICYFPKITLVRARNLLSRFSNPENAFKAELDDLVQIGFSEEIAHEFIIWRESFSVEKVTEELINFGIQTVSIFDNEYPILLKEINDPPPVLFYRGKLPSSELPTISIVGTRKCTAYGKQITKQIAGELAEQGVIIVSGLALGIDGIAHEAALEKGGLTLAVLGSGVDRRHVYPSSHQNLAEKIIESGGAVISEYPAGFEPTQYSFPARNRIIAGLSVGTLVAEAPTKSGALITAERCLDYNRDVFSVPHPLGSISGAGCNELLKKGAILVTSGQDIIESLAIGTNLRDLKITPKTVKKPSDELEAKIIELLQEGPKHINEIIKKLNLPGQQTTAKLTIMEMSGQITNQGGMTYNLL